MILSRTDDQALHIVLQTDHAAIAGEFACLWAPAATPHAPVHLAAAMHDEGWRDWEVAPDIHPESGRLLNFTEMDPAVHTAFYSAGVDRVAALDPYAGLLCSLHASGLYNGNFGMREPPPARGVPQQAIVDRFQAREEARRQALGIELDESVWENYRALQAWDTLSLAVCGRPIGSLPGGVRIGRPRPGCLQLAPWPFRGGAFAVAVPFRRLPDRAWPDAESLRRAWAAAAPEAEAVWVAPAA